ncbi:MAG: hypothetical protein WCQ72_04135 [Eubacteriales bacterium]
MDDGVINTAEHRVRKKVEGVYRLKRILVRTGLILFPLIPLLLGASVKVLSPLLWMTPVFLLVDVFILRYFFRYVDIEYEYAVVSGSLRVDIVYGNERRKSWLEVKFKDMSVIAPYSGEYTSAADDPSIKNRYEAVSSLTAPDCYYGTFNDDSGERSVIFFEPTNKILSLAKLYNKSTVIRTMSK